MTRVKRGNVARKRRKEVLQSQKDFVVLLHVYLEPHSNKQ